MKITKEIPNAPAMYEEGETIDGRYFVKGSLGAGGSSIVYQVFDEIRGEDLALKVFNAQIGLESVVRELKALIGLDHPNVIRVVDANQTRTNPPQWYLKTDFINGRPLDHFTSDERLSLDEAVDCVVQVLQALAALHPDNEAIEGLKVKPELTADEFDRLQELESAGLVHRDVKPQNVMRREDGSVVLLDFNIASHVGATMHTMSHTPGYQEPDPSFERWDPSPDLFATGVMLFELIAHEHPYPDRVPRADRTPTSAREHVPGLSADIEAFLSKACAPLKADRFTTAKAMLGALQDAAGLAAPAPSAPDRETKTGSPWGTAPCPLIPKVLRERHHNSEIPAPFGLLNWNGFDSTYWDRRDSANFSQGDLTKLVEALSFCQGIEPTGLFWPTVIETKRLPLKVRTSNAVTKAIETGLVVPGREIDLTDTLALPGFGRKTAIDLLCVLESINGSQLTQAPHGEPLRRHDIERLDHYLSEVWSGAVSSGDPRLPALIPGEPVPIGTLFRESLLGGDQSAAAMVAASNSEDIAAWAEACAQQPIDTAILEIIESSGCVRPQRKDGFLALFGLLDGRVHSQVEAAALSGVTGSRISQIASEARAKLSKTDWWVPSLGDAIKYLEGQVPIALTTADSDLKRMGLSNGLATLPAIEACCELLNIEFPFEIRGDSLFPSTSAEELKTANSIERYARPFGFLDIELAKSALGERTEGDLYSGLRLVGAVDLGDGCYWIPQGDDEDRQPAIRVARKLLVTSIMGVANLDDYRDALTARTQQTQNKQEHVIHIPTAIQLGVFLGRSTTIQLDSEATFSSAIELHKDEYLSKTDGAIFDALSQAPDQALRSQQIEDFAYAAGINRNTLKANLGYSAVSKKLGGGLWGIRSRRYESIGRLVAAAEPLKRAARRKQVVDFSIDAEGASMTFYVRNLLQTIVSVPSKIRQFVPEGHFEVLLNGESFPGLVRVSDRGLSSGYQHALRELGATEDDLVSAKFDKEALTVDLRLCRTNPEPKAQFAA